MRGGRARGHRHTCGLRAASSEARETKTKGDQQRKIFVRQCTIGRQELLVALSAGKIDAADGPRITSACHCSSKVCNTAAGSGTLLPSGSGPAVQRSTEKTRMGSSACATSVSSCCISTGRTPERGSRLTRGLRLVVDVAHFHPVALFGQQFHGGLKTVDVASAVLGTVR
jgi:hypothetical protein